jgi:hypothetical protein
MPLNRRKRRRAGDSPEQREFFLEQVRVVRNDLSDADLELAPARAISSVAAGLPLFGTTREQPAPRTWWRSILRWLAFQKCHG